MSFSFNCISQCLLILPSQLCVKGIQRLSKSIYPLEFGFSIKCGYGKVSVFLPHQRQAEYRPGSATDVIYYTLSGDMKRGSELPLSVFGGKLCVFLACKVLTTQSMSYYTNTLITSLLGSSELYVDIWELTWDRGVPLSCSISMPSLHLLDKYIPHVIKGTTIFSYLPAHY